MISGERLPERRGQRGFRHHLIQRPHGAGVELLYLNGLLRGEPVLVLGHELPGPGPLALLEHLEVIQPRVGVYEVVMELNLPSEAGTVRADELSDGFDPGLDGALKVFVKDVAVGDDVKAGVFAHDAERGQIRDDVCRHVKAPCVGI